MADAGCGRGVIWPARTTSLCNAAIAWPDMQAMSTHSRADATSRDHLHLVREEPIEPGTPPAARPRTIGRVIAQTALIADSAITRRRMEGGAAQGRGVAGRLLGRFR
jgi:hypothetical protein